MIPSDVMDSLGPALAAGVFVLLASRVREPLRLRLNAVLVAGAGGVYLSGGGLGVLELAYPALLLPVVYRAMVSYRFVAVGWLLHSAWDVVHHFWGHPIWPFMPTSSWGCMIFDALIALWFLTVTPPSTLSRARSAKAASSPPS
ncbi:MAG: hypothetical protein IPJ65_09880 [Archangiaceae bacterium]|nr:hypothetical protein [Archangiaceae bacterium]